MCLLGRVWGEKKVMLHRVQPIGKLIKDVKRTSGGYSSRRGSKLQYFGANRVFARWPTLELSPLHVEFNSAYNLT
jgi:hypothetical protein